MTTVNGSSALLTRPFTSSAARDIGLGRPRLRRMERNGTVRRLLRDVYVDSATEMSPELWAEAILLVVSPQSVVCDRSAAQIHGVDLRRYAELGGVPPLESFVLRGHEPTERDECAGGTRDLRPQDWCVIAGLRVTTPLRTAMDLGCKLPRRQAMAAMDALMRENGFTVADMAAVLPRYFRRRGVIQLRQLVPLTDPRAESPRESWVRLEILDAGLLAPEPQYWIMIDGVPTYRLDLAYPHARIAVEYDGEEFHSSAEDKARDQRRRAWLRRSGWIVIVLTKKSLDGEEHVWLAELRQALKSRAGLLGR